MQRSELRAGLRRRRAELRALLPRFRQLARERLARLEALPAFKAAREAIAARRRRRQRTAAAIAVLLLALLLIDCEGKPGPGTALAKATPMASVKPPVTPIPAKRGPLQARLEPQKRPGYALDARPGPDWLDDFRLQVAARSPRLSGCFNGSERGGVLRWTVSIDAKSGAVTDHDLAPLGTSAALSAEQKACVTRTLADPGYLLKDRPAEALPIRVSLILEF